MTKIRFIMSNNPKLAVHLSQIHPIQFPTFDILRSFLSISTRKKSLRTTAKIKEWRISLWWLVSMRYAKYDLIQNEIKHTWSHVEQCYQKTWKNIKFQCRWRDLWWPSLITYQFIFHFGWQPLPKITKMATTALPFKIEIYNKNKTPLSLGQTSTWTWNDLLTWHKISYLQKMQN